MKIFSGGYEIIESGTVISYNLEPIEFKFSDTYIIRVSVTRDSTKKPLMKTDIIDGKILSVECINPHYMNHFGSAQPFEIGMLRGKRALADFKIVTIENKDNEYSSFVLTYSFYTKAD